VYNLKIQINNIMKLNSHIDKWFIIYGLEIQTGVPYGTPVKLLWVNDTHICLVTKSSELFCLRVYLGEKYLKLQK